MEVLAEAFVAMFELAGLVLELIINCVVALIDFSLRCVSRRYRESVDPPGPLFSNRSNERGRRVNRRGMPLWMEGSLAIALCASVAGVFAWFFLMPVSEEEKRMRTLSQVELLVVDGEMLTKNLKSGIFTHPEEDAWGTPLQVEKEFSLEVAKVDRKSVV